MPNGTKNASCGRDDGHKRQEYGAHHKIKQQLHGDRHDEAGIALVGVAADTNAVGRPMWRQRPLTDTDAILRAVHRRNSIAHADRDDAREGEEEVGAGVGEPEGDGTAEQHLYVCRDDGPRILLVHKGPHKGIDCMA